MAVGTVMVSRDLGVVEQRQSINSITHGELMN